MEEILTVKAYDGFVSIRAGAIIQKNGKLLMTGSVDTPFYYSVGGRVNFGETAAEAVVREVFEETGCKMEVERLGFVHENYFEGDSAATLGKPVYEICFYFYMKVPDGFEPVCDSINGNGTGEFLKWIEIDTPEKYYPEFFREELKNSCDSVKHIVTNELR